MDISSKPVELGDYQGRFGLLGNGNSGRKLGPVRSLPALDLTKLRSQFARVTGQMSEHRLALGVQAEAAPPLAVGRNAVVGDKFVGHGAFCNRQTSVCMLHWNQITSNPGGS